MGFRPFPFYAAAFYYHAEEFVRGNPLDPRNSLRFDMLKFNLPGSPTFNPSLPWVMKWDSLIGNIAAEIIAYVDDL